MKALFFRNCINATEYENLSSKYPFLGQWLEYDISKIIKLNITEYNNFKNSFTIDTDFIVQNIPIMHMDETDKVFCIFVTTNKKDGFLVYSAGYKYARYVAKI